LLTAAGSWSFLDRVPKLELDGQAGLFLCGYGLGFG